MQHVDCWLLSAVQKGLTIHQSLVQVFIPLYFFSKIQSINHTFLSGWSYAAEPSLLSRSTSAMNHLINGHKLSILVEKITCII